MTTLADRAAYMREYRLKNGDRMRAQARARDAKKAAQRTPVVGKTAAEKRAAQAKNTRDWRARNPEKAKDSKRKYYASEAGKAQKKKEDALFVARGGRAIAEAKRAARPMSEPRKTARAANSALRRARQKEVDEFSAFVLREAVRLRALREHATGIKWHIDHIVAVAKGGKNDADNFQVVPALWNQRKAAGPAIRFIGA